MRYLLLVYSSESVWTEEARSACMVESTELCHDLQAKGQFIAASPLHPVATAASIRVRSGQPLITAGPFAETSEQLGGFFLIDVPDLDEAIAIAQRLPAAKKGTVEIRPTHPLSGLPVEAFDRLVAEVPAGGQAKYMLLCYDDAAAWRELGEAALNAAMQEAAGMCHELTRRHEYISASPLASVETATSVRLRDGKRWVTAGPFAETREFLGGYYLILARDLNDAVRVAAAHPGARHGTVEVRRVFDLANLPRT